MITDKLYYNWSSIVILSWIGPRITSKCYKMFICFINGNWKVDRLHIYNYLAIKLYNGRRCYIEIKYIFKSIRT